MKVLINLLFLLVVPFYAISQEPYPRKLIIESDTLVGITIPQLGIINKSLVERELFKMEIKSLNSILELKDKKLSEFSLQIIKQDTMINRYQVQVDYYQRIYKEQLLVISETQKKALRQKRLAWTIGGIGIGVGVAGLIVMVVQ